MARGNNGVIMRALLAPVISRGTLILVQTFIQTVMTFLFRSKSVVESLSVFFPPPLSLRLLFHYFWKNTEDDVRNHSADKSFGQDLFSIPNETGEMMAI